MSAHGFCVISQETGLHFYLKPCSVALLKQSAHFFRNRPAPFLLRRLVKLVASGYFPQYASLVNSLRKLAQRYILPGVFRNTLRQSRPLSCQRLSCGFLRILPEISSLLVGVNSEVLAVAGKHYVSIVHRCVDRAAMRKQAVDYLRLRVSVGVPLADLYHGILGVYRLDKRRRASTTYCRDVRPSARRF